MIREPKEMPYISRLVRFLPFVLFMSPSLVYARAERGAVAVGHASIASSATNTLTVVQSSPMVVIDWDRFDVDENETVIFQQPTSSSIALISVYPKDGVSRVRGQLT